MQNFLNQILRWRVNEVLKNSSEKSFPTCKLCQAEYAKRVRENVSGCKLCQVENERFSRYYLSKSENLSNRTDLKTNF